MSVSKATGRRFMAFGDTHIPYQCEHSLAVMLAVMRRFKPALTVNVGDTLDCTQFSTHEPSWDQRDTEYSDDVDRANRLFDDVQRYSDYYVVHEGNHEVRVKRWAARTAEGRGALAMLDPQRVLSRGRRSFKWIPYGSANKRFAYYRINSRLFSVHGWSHAKNSARKHLELAQGKSVIYGHVHRAESLAIQNIWGPHDNLEARCTGCLCDRFPFYKHGSPGEWVNAFILGWLGKKSDTLYTIPIMRDHCILPDGTKVTA